jgi:predicted flap endonuclease-1-like 5' DNA nuclease
MTKKTAKKTTSKSKKEDKSKSATTIKKMNSKLKSTKKDLKNQVKALTTQVKKLSKKSVKKTSKLLKKLDKAYHEKLASLQTETEVRFASIPPVHSDEFGTLSPALPNQTDATDSETAVPANRATLTNKSPASKARPKVTSKAVTISSIQGIGPIIQKKLALEGITSLEDIANTPQGKIETLKKFAKQKGFITWKEQAKTLLAGK